MIIDAHTHGCDGASLEGVEAAGGAWARGVIEGLRRVTKRKPHFFDAASRVEMLHRTGIDFQVVTPPNYLDPNYMPADPASQLALATATNDNMAHFRDASKGKLIPVGTIALLALEQGGLEEMERAVKGLGLKGINVPTNVFGKPLDLPEFEPFWARVAELDTAVWIHPGHPVGQNDRPYEKDYDMTHNFGWPFETQLTLARLVFTGIMGKYPTLKIISHHLGGGIPFLFGRITETYSPDNGVGHPERKLSPYVTKPLHDYFASFYYDTAVGGGAAAIRCTSEVFGADRIVFATDAPWGPGTGEERLIQYPQVVRSVGLTAEENEKIFSGNMRRVLGL